MDAIVTLTTDFGAADAYVATMKGVMLGINPRAQLIDICHAIQPGNILQASYILSTAYSYFPAHTIHLVVVDPGVGSQRKAIILRTPLAYFVAPDNGILTHVVQHALPVPASGKEKLLHVELRKELEAVVITNPEFWNTPVSPTFHGRDILAPVAAHLSLGVPLKEFGDAVNAVTVLPPPVPLSTQDGSLSGHILHIDSFGNLITDITAEDLPEPRKGAYIRIGNRDVSGLSRTYADGEGLLALIGSSGHLEIALKEGNACALLNVKIGDEVIITTGGGNDR